MRKIILIIIFLFNIYFIYSQTDFENNFLSGYLSFERVFQSLGGDYGLNFFPFLSNGYGGRETALSGAFTGVADDISALEVNPAGTASLTYTELFISHNKLMGDVNYNTLAYTMRLNDLGFGLGVRILYLPFTRYDYFGEDAGNGVITYSVITLNASYNFLRTYQFFGLSVGGNIKLYIFSVPENIAPDQSKVNITFDIGLLTRFDFLKAYNTSEKNFSVGLTLKNFGPFTDGEPPPTKVALGIGYKPIESLLISVDFNYLLNFSDLTYLNWSLSCGLEWKFTKFTSLLGGVLIKSNPSLSLGLNLNFEEFSITATYNPDFVDVSRFSVSASLKFGDLGRKQSNDKIRKYYSLAIKLMNNGNFIEAKKILDYILKKDPTFNPARKSRENCIKQIEIDKKLKNIMDSQEELK